MFLKGFKAMLPITPGILPFGLVMGTVASNAQMDLIQTMLMNILVFAGAAQLASIDLMTKNVEVLVVVATGLIINLRFILYSAALSTKVEKLNIALKSVAAYCLTDQSYTTLTANEDKLKNTKDNLNFYLGSSLCMIITWQTAVFLGFSFGNFAPKELNLEYAVPLSFVALVMPTLKNKTYWIVAMFSSILSILLINIPYNLGLLSSGFLGVILGAFLSQKRRTK